MYLICANWTRDEAVWIGPHDVAFVEAALDHGRDRIATGTVRGVRNGVPVELALVGMIDPRLVPDLPPAPVRHRRKSPG